MSHPSFVLRLSLPLAALLAFSPLSATASDVDLLGSGQTWYKKSNGFAGGSGTVSGGKLTYRPTNTNGEMISYFTPANTPVSLEVGQQITLNFTYSFNNPLSGNALFRIGLFASSNVTRVSSNNFDSANANGATGYFITTGPGSSNSEISRLYVRGNSGAGNLIGGTGDSFPSTNDAGGYVEAGAGYGLKDGVAYNGFLRIAYISSDTVRVTYSFDSNVHSISWEDQASRYTSFDTVGIVVGRNGSDVTTLTMTGLSYDVAPIPEPAVSALVGALAVVTLLCIRRRRLR